MTLPEIVVDARVPPDEVWLAYARRVREEIQATLCAPAVPPVARIINVAPPLDDGHVPLPPWRSPA